MYNNIHAVPLPMALWLTLDDYKYAKHANEISATTLLKSPRYIIETRRAMYPEEFPEDVRPVVVEDNGLIAEKPDIQERIASRVGTAIHDSIERAWKTNYKQGLALLGYPEDVIERVKVNPENPSVGDIVVMSENRLYKEITVEGHTFVISGQYDMIIDGEIHDIKTTSTYSYETGVNDEKYRLQGSIYRWLNPDLITSDEITINFLFLDWKRFQNTKENYPNAKALGKKYKLLSLQETEMYIRNKLKALVKYWDSPTYSIPCCTPEEIFSRPPVFKYFKTGYQEGKRSTKNFDTFAEASAYRAKQGHLGDIVEIRENPFTCPYCNMDEVEAMQIKLQKPKGAII